MRYQLKWRNVIALAVVLILFCVILCLFVSWLFREQPCGLVDSRQFIRAICHSYDQRVIDGKLCPLLCQSDWGMRRCVGHLTGKRVLLFERESDEASDFTDLSNPYLTSLVVKSSQWSVQYKSGKVEPQLSWIEETHRLLTRSIAEVFLRQPDPKEVMRDFWDYPLRSDDPPTPAVLKNSVWALAEQREYIMLKHLSSSNLVPTLMGTCGPLYAVTNTPPPAELRIGYLPLRSHPLTSWERRVSFALQILRLLRKLELHSRPALLLCDMKPDNFGLGADHTIRLLDLDTVLVEEDLFSRDCTNHNDCSLFACLGECVRGRCRRRRGFSTLQSACRLVFLGAPVNGFRGLLSGSPGSVTERVNAALSECAEPRAWQSVQEAYGRLETALTSALMMGRNV